MIRKRQEKDFDIKRSGKQYFQLLQHKIANHIQSKTDLNSISYLLFSQIGYHEAQNSKLGNKTKVI